MKVHDIAMYFETSAKTALNVTKAFDEVAKQLFLNQIQKRKIPMQEANQKIQEQKIQLKK